MDREPVTDLSPPPEVLSIASRLNRAGHDVWAVGGAVRDVLLGGRGGDWDLATSARPQEVQRLFKRTVPIGIEHGTVGVLGRDRVLYEVTTFRRDVETFGRRARVEFSDTIEDDLARRDFTMNAIAWHPLRAELFDPFGGRTDLERHRLRAVGDPATRFAEDYLRILRALRFAGHFGLEVDESTWAALCAAVGHLKQLSAERVREELMKVLTKTVAASTSLELYERSGSLASLYPELAALSAVGLDGDDTAWRRTLRAVDAVPITRPRVRLAALLHAIGMPAARSRDLRGGYRYTGHEQLGARKTEELLSRLKFSNIDNARVVALVRHQRDLFPPDAPDAGVRRWLRDVTPALVRDLFRLRIALWRAAPGSRDGADLSTRWRHAHAVLLSQPALDVTDLAIGGAELADLGIAPGPLYGKILRALLERVLDDPELNDRDQLVRLARDMAGA